MAMRMDTARGQRGDSCMESLLTTDDVVERLRLPKSTLETWRSEGRGPKFIRVGRRIRYRPSDLVEWLEAQTVQTVGGGR